MASESAYCFNDYGERMPAKCSNISALARLTSLHSLDLSGCDQIGDLSLLTGRTGLRSLRASEGVLFHPAPEKKPRQPRLRSLRNETGCPIAIANIR
jgi:hypothetical protein